MVINDYYCKKCDVLHEGIEVYDTDKPVTCPDCKNEMLWVPSKMSFKSTFKDSHNSEYNKIGRRYK